MENFYDCRTNLSISKDEFIEMYNKSYFCSAERVVKGVTQNSKVAETEIENYERCNQYSCLENRKDQA